MSLHFCSHPWEVQDMEDGTLIAFRQRDLDPETVSVLEGMFWSSPLETPIQGVNLGLMRSQVWP